VGCGIAEALVSLDRDRQGPEAWDGWLSHLERLVDQAAQLGALVTPGADPPRDVVLSKSLAGSQRQPTRWSGHGRDARQGRLDGQTYLVLFFVASDSKPSSCTNS